MPYDVAIPIHISHLSAHAYISFASNAQQNINSGSRTLRLTGHIVLAVASAYQTTSIYFGLAKVSIDPFVY